MNSNENDAMECNDALSETNILICYMHESELRMQSYEAMNMSIWIRDLGKKNGVNPRLEGEISPKSPKFPDSHAHLHRIVTPHP